MVDQMTFREVMAHYPTGVTVVTSRGETGEPVGLTVNAFTSVSLDPVLLLVCIHHEAASHDPITKGGGFAVNVLSARQGDLAIRFSAGRVEDRFVGLDWEESPQGNPLIPGGVAWLDCRVSDIFPGGDHSIVVAEVTACESQGGKPLLFHGGALREMMP